MIRDLHQGKGERNAGTGFCRSTSSGQDRSRPNCHDIVLAGERQAAYEESRKRLGITREAVWIQATPAGDVAVVYVESDDVEVAYKDMAVSQEPFDRWFREHVLDVHGIDLQNGLAPSEQIMDYRA